MSWSISGKLTRPGYWETVMFGWHAVVEQHQELNGMWQAFIEPLTEPFKGTPPIKASQFFYGGDLGGRFEGTGWCYREILSQWSKLFTMWRKEPSFSTNPLRQQIVERLRQYDLRTELLLVGIYGLTTAWGDALEQQRQNIGELRDDEATLMEPTILIWETVHDIGVSWRGLENRIPQKGYAPLSPKQRETEAKKWAQELMQYPFYPTINTFAQAVIDWIQTCDLEPFLSVSNDEVRAMWNCLEVFNVDQP